MQKLKSSTLIAVVLFIVVIVLGAYLFNQQQQRKADIELAQLALEQSKVKNQTAEHAEAASEPADQGLTGIEGLDQQQQAKADADLDASVEGAVAAVQEAKKSQNSLASKLSQQIDAEYHDDRRLNKSLSHYGLKAMSSAPSSLKATAGQIDQMLAPHLSNVWGRGNLDQVAKELEGWSEDGNTLTYRAAWGSDRSQCTWYVVRWNKNSNQVINEGYMPCF